MIGYSPSEAIEPTLKVYMTDAARSKSTMFTKALVLHPIACVIALVATLQCCRTGFRNNLAGIFIGCNALMFVVTVIAFDFQLANVSFQFSTLLLPFSRFPFLLLLCFFASSIPNALFPFVPLFSYLSDFHFLLFTLYCLYSPPFSWSKFLLLVRAHANIQY